MHILYRLGSVKSMKSRLVLSSISVISALEKLIYGWTRKTREIPEFDDELDRMGFSYGNDSLIENSNLEVLEEVVSNGGYVKKIILTKESIEQFANDIISSKEVRAKLESFFNGQYCIDFIAFYRIVTLPEKKIHDSVYANHWHTDTLLTKNCVKILMLPKKLSWDEGPLKVYCKSVTKRLKALGFTRGENIPKGLLKLGDPELFTGHIKKVLFVRPHVCLHAAGVPYINRSREQIMIQLNPSIKYGYRSDLFEMQYRREPTLPFIKNIWRPKASF